MTLKLFWAEVMTARSQNTECRLYAIHLGEKIHLKLRGSTFPIPH